MALLVGMDADIIAHSGPRRQPPREFPLGTGGPRAIYFFLTVTEMPAVLPGAKVVSIPGRLST